MSTENPRPAGLRAMSRALLLAALAVGLLQGCSDHEQEKLLPGFAHSRGDIRQLSLKGPGGRSVLTLDRGARGWTAREYRGWPVQAAKVQQLFDALAGARIVERKTARSELYPRLGVEDIQSPEAGGLELSWDGSPGLVVGKPGPAGRGQYVRHAGTGQALMIDQSLPVRGAALDWLDPALLDIPAARIRSVRVQPRDGQAFDLLMDDQGHRLSGVAADLSDPERCAELANALDRLVFEDIESETDQADPGANVAGALGAEMDVPADFILVFESVDGRRVLASGWRREARYWISLSVALDETIAREWFSRDASRDADAATATLGNDVRDLQSRLRHRRFLVSIERTAVLIRRLPQYLRTP